MGWLRKKKKEKPVNKGIRKMAKAARMEHVVRCVECGHLYNPDNIAARALHEHKND